MHKTLLAGVSALALSLTATSAFAQDIVRGEGDFSWDSLDAFEAEYGDVSGEITLWSPWNNPGDAAQFQAVVDFFEEATGVTVQVGSSPTYEEQARIDIAAGSPANITILPQPGLLADFAEQGALTDLGAEATDWLENNYAAGESWAALGQFAGEDGEVRQYAFPFKLEVKSLVWYSPDNFDEMGYEIPETMEALLELQEQIKADGGTPWCIGLESGGATGWPATDWIEDIMLRTQSPEAYDQWVTNELPFNSPEVVNAIEIFGSIVKDDANVAGGTAAVATTAFGDSPAGLFTIPPQCYLHRQASFIPSFFPEGSEAGVDYDFFYMPPYESEPDLGRPVLGSGTLVSITRDAEGARAFLEYIKTPIAHEIWMAQENSNFLTAYGEANPDTYSSDQLRQQGEILLEATTFRFDGSDMMPGAIGAGAFWSGMVDFVNGLSAQDAADQIQAAWDQL
ncbi:ABC transporter substrate-binding protein [Pelagibacterium luteolum]|uniref:Alpha-glucoside transport system substrate-binding protein n=1 Tax=Pelagibacterium luteolum TaxID=440168 RepID=A0A1G7U3W9_9HYPH|nr:ABC transporter substrate-binding protein [Pelagibacterium luteolum]SDG41470.1 alpha-glucoside transport system substrate-binding protein [Pelagibacterium luteolum]